MRCVDACLSPVTFLSCHKRCFLMPASHSGNRSTIQLMIDLRLGYAVVSSGLILVGFFWNNLKGFDLQYIFLIVGIFLANVFMFVVNDFYDASHDSFDPAKRARNLFCSPDTRQLGTVILYTSLGLSLVLGAIVSPLIFLIIALFNVLAFSYSAPPIKLRNRLYWDWIFVFLWKGLILAASYVYFFGTDVSVLNPFMYGTLSIVMLFSLISQMDNQIRDFEVDKTNNTGHSVQHLGHKTSFRLQFVLLTLFFAFSIAFSYLSGLYITVVLILVNVSLYFVVNPKKYSEILEFASLWVVVLFMEHFTEFFSYRQQLLFSLWVMAMIGIAVIHAKRTNLFEDRRSIKGKIHA